MAVEKSENIFRSAATRLVLPNHPLGEVEIIGQPITWIDATHCNSGICIVRHIGKPTLYVLASNIEEGNVLYAITPFEQTDDPSNEHPLVKAYKTISDGKTLQEIAAEIGVSIEEARDTLFTFSLISSKCFEYRVVPQQTVFEDLESLIQAGDADALRYLAENPTAGLQCLGCYFDYRNRRVIS